MPQGTYFLVTKTNWMKSDVRFACLVSSIIPSNRGRAPSMFDYEMARWWSFITYVTKSCRDKNDLQLQELTVAQDFEIALSSKHIFKGQYVDYLKQDYLTWSTSWFFLDTSLTEKWGVTYVTSHTWHKLKILIKSK